MNLISPLPTSPEDAPFLEQLHAELVGELYRRARAALLALCAVLVILWQVLGDAPRREPRLVGIYSALAAVVALRLAFHFYLERRPEALPSVALRHGLFMLGTFLVGVGYAALNLAAYPVLDAAGFGMVAVSLTGINAGALLSMSASPASYSVYMLPSISSLIWLTARSPKPGYEGVMAILLVVYLVAMMVLGLQVHATMRGHILLRLRLGEMALRDTLTGLKNRRFMMEFMDGEWGQIMRAWHRASPPPNPRSSALIMLDIDHFKRVNDTHGHLAGDAVLKQMAALLTDTVRNPDVVARWGGEEFVVVALDTSREAPLVLAERIRAAVSAHTFVIPGDLQLPVTCSIGYAYLPFLPDLPGYLGWEEILHLADGGLYLAKQRGRNRTVAVLEGVSRHQEALTSLWIPGQDLLHAIDAGAVKVT